MSPQLHAPSHRSVGFLLASTGQLAAHAFRERISRHGVHPRQFAVLRCLSTDGPCSQRELATRVGLPASRMVAIVDSLEDAGLVARRGDPQDRRAKQVALTDAGTRLFKKLAVSAGTLDAQITSALNAQERAELTRLLTTVESTLDPKGSGDSRIW